MPQRWRYLAAKVNKALRVIISVAAVLKKLEISRPYQRLAAPPSHSENGAKLFRLATLEIVNFTKC
ncbi:hypothetical protein CBX96_16900 [Shewanella sp. BC20]|nr:hypothetical protein CBX96_16900 [Shewanella sp. BC20]